MSYLIPEHIYIPFSYEMLVCVGEEASGVNVNIMNDAWICGIIVVYCFSNPAAQDLTGSPVFEELN